jgi:glycerol-3-phosphate cytidylyltransferase-like family protein
MESLKEEVEQLQAEGEVQVVRIAAITKAESRHDVAGERQRAEHAEALREVEDRLAAARAEAERKWIRCVRCDDHLEICTIAYHASMYPYLTSVVASQVSRRVWRTSSYPQHTPRPRQRQRRHEERVR